MRLMKYPVLWYNRPMRKNAFRVIPLLLAFVFIFMVLGADVNHNHEDSEFHKDCPACTWLTVSVFIFVVISTCLGVLCTRPRPVFTPCINIRNSNFKPENYLRSPPLPSFFL